MISRKLYIDDFVSQRLVESDDGAGGYEEEWADEVEFKGRLSLIPRGISERYLSDRETVIGMYKIYCDPLDINESYRIRLKDNSRVFEVEGVEKPSNLKSGHYQIIVKEIL